MSFPMKKDFVFILLALLLLCTGNTVSATEVTKPVVQPQFAQATVERQLDGQLTFSWQGIGSLGEVTIYWENQPENLRKGGVPLATVSAGSTITVPDPSPGARPYFKLVSTNGASLLLAERNLPLQGVGNFRDLGGYKTADGRTVKWGMLFRSDQLIGMTAQDQSYVAKSGLKKMIDLRTVSEAKAKPDPAIPNVAYVHLPLFVEHPAYLDANAMLAASDWNTMGKPGDYLKNYNKALVADVNQPHQKFLDMIATSKSFPLVWHCTSGKDRTGFETALILYALGVPEDTIMEDYLLSNKYNEAYNSKLMNAIISTFSNVDQADAVRAVLVVRPSYLQTAFDEIKKQYGSIDQYLDSLGLTSHKRKHMQDMYLNENTLS